MVTAHRKVVINVLKRLKKSQIINCNRCGRNHNVNECPAFRQECKACGLLNHFEIKCRNRDKNTVNSMVAETSSLTLNSVEIN